MSDHSKHVHTLRALAQAVVDLADGMGGDDQEQERAAMIAAALEQIADDLAPDKLCWMRGCVALIRDPQRTPYCAVHAKRQNKFMRQVSANYREQLKRGIDCKTTASPSQPAGTRQTAAVRPAQPITVTWQ